MLGGQPRIASSTDMQAHKAIINIAVEFINRIGAII
jgi:hypothetical protein